MDDAGCGSDLGIGCGCDVFFGEIHQPAVLLQQRKEGDDLRLCSRRRYCGLRRRDRLQLLLGLRADRKKHEDHANGGGYRLRGECEILFGKINGSGIKAEKDGAAGNKAVFHTGRDSARCRISWQWRFHPTHMGFCV